jgi:hypothetical protein
LENTYFFHARRFFLGNILQLARPWALFFRGGALVRIEPYLLNARHGLIPALVLTIG